MYWAAYRKTVNSREGFNLKLSFWEAWILNGAPYLLLNRPFLKLYCMEGGDNVGISFQFAVSWLPVTCCGGNLVCCCNHLCVYCCGDVQCLNKY